jgi:hypothetical protein
MKKTDACRRIRLRGAYNIKAHPISEYEVGCAAGDLSLAEEALRSYVRLLDGVRDDIEYQVYYRKRFLKIAENIAVANAPAATEATCTYRDIILIICMFRDPDMWKGTEHEDSAEFRRIADELSSQIGYDYDAAVEKCRKRAEKDNKESDVGDEAMSLMLKKARREAEYQQKQREEKEHQ